MPEVKLNGKRKAENGKLFSEIREIRDLRSLAIPFSLFSLNSLNSLYSLLPGIVFDTHEGGGCALLGAGYRFRYPCLHGVCFSCWDGYCFRYPWGRWVRSLGCWVSFSIPMRALRGSYCYSNPRKAFNPTLLRCLIKDAEMDSGGK